MFKRAIGNGEAATVNPGIIVEDVDSDNIASAVVSLVSGLQTGDVLAFSNQLGISAVFNSGVLTMTGTAPVAAYQQALRTVVYRNDLPDPNRAARLVQFQVSDGLLWSAAVSRQIQ